MSLFNNFILFGCMLFNIACNPTEPIINDDSKNENNVALKWLEGKFVYMSNYGVYTECWTKTDSVNYTGLGYFFETNKFDTLFRQRIHITIAKNKVYMLFNVKNQNDNKDVEFILTHSQNNLYTFENPLREFPSVISYKIYSDSLVEVRQQGFKKNSKEETVNVFEMKRVK